MGKKLLQSFLTLLLIDILTASCSLFHISSGQAIFPLQTPTNGRTKTNQVWVPTTTPVAMTSDTEQTQYPNLTSEDIEANIFMDGTYFEMCSGKGVADIVKYSKSNNSVHPLIVFTPNGMLDATYWVRYPFWKPGIPQAAQLVHCPGIPERIKDRTCKYGKNTILDVYISTYPMTLRVISSGNVIAKKDFVSIGYCPTMLTSKNLGLLKGVFPTNEVDEWLKEYME